MKARNVNIRVTPVEYRRLKTEAAARGTTLSRCLRECLFEYLALKGDLAAPFEVRGLEGGDVQGAERARLVHRLLADLEDRVAASIDGQAQEIARLERDTQVLTGMIDRFYLSYLQHTPEISPAIQDAAAASANRRYKLWRQALFNGGSNVVVLPSEDDDGDANT